MLRQARPGDEAAIDSFLARHAETSMFLRANLADFGLSGSDDPRATTYWLCEHNAQITAVFGRSNAGFLLLQAPNASPAQLRAFRAQLSGQTIAGLTGDTAQIDQLLPHLSLPHDALSLNRAEPLFHLSLNTLKIPDLPGTLRAPQNSDRAMLLDWVWDYDTSALGAPKTQATRDRAARTVDQILSDGRTRILDIDGQPVAKCAFNATLPDMVQIGGVYTPPDLRARGYARRAVALHLEEARATGVTTAILFASGEPACRAYRAIGFQQIGSYRLAILNAPILLAPFTEGPQP